MWHLCEEEQARENVHTRNAWRQFLKNYVQELCAKYKTQQEQIQKWYNVCLLQFPIYLNYWKRQGKDMAVSILQEEVFDVPYRLPSGRQVRLRGKWDGLDLVGKGKNAAIYLRENKTKGDIDEQQIKRQLRFDLQTLFYLVALYQKRSTSHPAFKTNTSIAGVQYNVVRRPLSGGLDSIRQHQPSKSNPQGESLDQFYTRLADRIREKPEQYFMRWQSEVSSQDVTSFREKCLDPLLESLWDWWEWVQNTPDPFVHHSSTDGGYHVGPHWQTPYGLFNVLAEGGSTEVDEYLENGSELGLERTQELFSELA
jgi:hypothetical protein